MPYGYTTKALPGTLEYEIFQGSFVGSKDEYHEALYEHAWLLRAEGLLDKDIAKRLGCSRTAVGYMARRFGRRMTWAMRHVSWANYHSTTKFGLSRRMQNDQKHHR